MLHRLPKQGAKFMVLSVLFVMCAISAMAQTTSTTILGTVTDAAGAALPGAKITITNTLTNVRREGVTSSTGDFSFPLLDNG
ncbi:MAG: carboxypeptidase-like regulatory domain-containing protein, partial [Blastocatellia bacterium]